jgi:hypothetical protein
MENVSVKYWETNLRVVLKRNRNIVFDLQFHCEIRTIEPGRQISHRILKIGIHEHHPLGNYVSAFECKSCIGKTGVFRKIDMYSKRLVVSPDSQQLLDSDAHRCRYLNLPSAQRTSEDQSAREYQ